MNDLKLKAWHVQNLIDVEPDAQVVLLVEAEKENAELRQRLEKAEAERDESTQKLCNFFIILNVDKQQANIEAEDWLHKHDIKQHIKALESILSENSRSIAYPYMCNTDVVYSDDIKFEIEQLRKELGNV